MKTYIFFVKNIKNNLYSARFILICILLLVVFSWFCANTPFISDDYIFSRGIGQPFADIMAMEAVQPQPPATLSDVFYRPLQMYETWDGRLSIYLIFGTLLALPNWVYVTIIPLLIIGTAFCLLLHIYGTCWRKELTVGRFLFVVGLLVVALPSFGDIYFWRTGSGYAVSLFCSVLFLLPYRFRFEKPTCGRQYNFICIILFFILSFFLGCIEFLTPILCSILSWAACLLFWWKCQRNKVQKKPCYLGLYIAGAVAVTLGCIVVFLAPGNEQRMLLRTPDFLQLGLWDKIELFLLRQPHVQGMFWLPYLILGWAFFILLRWGGSPRWHNIPLLTWIYLGIACLGQGAYLFAPAPPQRAYSIITLFLLLAGMIAGRQASIYAKVSGQTRLLQLKYWACRIFILWCLGLLFWEADIFLTANKASLERDRLYSLSKDKDICVPSLPVRGDRYMVLGSYQQDIEYDSSFWINQAVSAYWGLRSVALCPRQKQVFSAPEYKRSTFVQYWDRMAVNIKDSPQGLRPDKIYIYYYGKPGLLRFLPQSWADSLVKWLGTNEYIQYKQWLVPLLFACGTASLEWTDRLDGSPEGCGEAKLWGIYPVDAPFWLVKPGNGPASFDLIHLCNVH